jgi:hypothetical protein
MRFFNRIKEYLARRKKEKELEKIIKEKLGSLLNAKENLELNIKLTRKDLKEADQDETE